MAEINTVSVSGIVFDHVGLSKTDGIPEARFYLQIEGASTTRQHGLIEIVAYAQWIEVVKKLSKGERVIIVGALNEWRGKGMRDIQIKVRNLIRLPKPGLSVFKWRVSPVNRV